MLAKISVSTAIAVLASLPCRAHYTVFSVRNLTAVPWDLVDVTEAPPGSTYVLGRLPADPGPAPAPVRAADNRFTLEAGATVTLGVHDVSGSLGQVALALQSGPGSSKAPCAKACLHQPVGDRSWPEALDRNGQVHPMNRFCIQPNGSFGVLAYASAHPADGPRVAAYPSGDQPSSGSQAEPSRPHTIVPLTVANLSRSFWYMNVGTGGVPVPGARLRTWNARGQAMETPMPSRPTTGAVRNKSSLRFDIPPQCEFLLPLDPAWTAWLREFRKGKRSGVQVLAPARPGGELKLQRRGTPGADLHLKGDRLEIQEREEKAAAEPGPDLPGASAATTSPSGPGLPPSAGPATGPARASTPPQPSASGGVDAAPALTEAEALRKDLAESAMFLGNDEAQRLAGYLGLAVDVHIPIARHPDSKGRTRIGIRSRFGQAEPSSHPRGGLILLNQRRHFTVLRPAVAPEPARYVSENGKLYVEVTRTVAGPGGDREVPAIPCDGHCLVSALHYLHTGALPEPGQVEHYRRHVAGALDTGALTALAAELKREILAEAFLVLPDGRFPTLGPAFSGLLLGDAAFMDRYEQALRTAAVPATAETHAPASDRKRDESPGFPLDIQEELRPAPPLHGIPLAWQKPTVGKPRMLVINDSPASWCLEPWEGNVASFVLEKGGKVAPMDPKRQYRLPPRTMIVVFVEGAYGFFGFRDSSSGEAQAWAELGVQDVMLGTLPSSRRRTGVPPGVFSRRTEDAQSFIIRAKAYPPAQAQSVRAFPPLPRVASPGTAPADLPSPTTPHGETLAEPLPGTSAERDDLLELERPFAKGKGMILLNQSDVTWYLAHPDGDDGTPPILATGCGLEPAPREARLRLDPGSRIPVGLDTETGLLALQDSICWTYGHASWDDGVVEVTIGGPWADALARPMLVERVPGTVDTFRIAPAANR